MRLCTSILSLIGFALCSSTLAIDSRASDSISDESSENATNLYTDFSTTVAKRTPSTRKPSPTMLEDLYIERFGNDVYDLTPWHTIKEWYKEVGEPTLRRYAAKAHEKAGYGKVVVDMAYLNLRDLIFKTETYRTRKVDVVIYSIKDGWRIHDKRNYWYFTEGVRKDCVFYLLPAGPRGREFKLEKLVCCVKVF